MNLLNAILNRTADILLAPFAALPLVGLMFWGVVAGVLMTIVFKRTTNQRALSEIADQMRAQMLAVRLFRDDLVVTLACQLRLMKLVCRRLGHSIAPMLVMFVPFVLVMVQLALRYERLPLTEGDEALVEMFLSPDAWKRCHDVALEIPAGMLLKTPGLRDEARHSISWRIRVEEALPSSLRWQLDEQEVKKSLAVSKQPQQLSVVSQRRPGPRFWDRLFHPAEVALPHSSPVEQVDVFYPSRRSILCLGMNLPWWLNFLFTSMLTALMVRPILGVQF